MSSTEELLGKLIGNTGEMTVHAALKDSYAVKRGGFVRIRHQEERDGTDRWVLGRVVKLSRENMLFDEKMGSEVSDVRLLTDTSYAEDVFAQVEIIGYVTEQTGEIKTPRRPLDPGAELYPVTGDFLQQFYEYTPNTSVRMGNLVGYEEGDNKVPVYLDVDKIATEHLAVLAMTGAGKSYTIGRLVELMLAQMNASVLIFDPHGEYGRAVAGNSLQFQDYEHIDEETQVELQETQEEIQRLQEQGGGVNVYAPDGDFADQKYGIDNYTPLKLRLDSLGRDELRNVMPSMTEPQERLLSVVLRYWEQKYEPPRTVSDLISLLTTNLEQVKNWSQLSEEEQSALNTRSASIIALRIRNLIKDAGIFYDGSSSPIDIKDVVGRRNSVEEGSDVGRIAVVDLQNVPKQAMEVVVAVMGNDLLNAVSDSATPIRPVFTVMEEGHTFAPGQGTSIAEPVIQKIAAEGRKFGIGLGIVSQRPSKLDSDVTSQCNTLLTMRIKNPDDQQFIRQASEMLSEQDVNELPALSTGEALITGEAIRAPLLVKIGPKALKHGGMSPEVVELWRQD